MVNKVARTIIFLILNLSSYSFGLYVSKPYQVSIYCPAILCQGAIVSTSFVVTTATCILTLSTSDVKVTIGLSDDTEYSVQAIHTHPNFIQSTYDYNIAMLKLQQPISVNGQVIPTANVLPADNAVVIVTTSGFADSLGTYHGKAFFSLKKLSFSYCQSLKNNQLTSSMFCASDLLGLKDSCPGDQGAPMMYNNELVGIYNWGGSCGLAIPSSPVFTSVPVVKSWITNIINTN